MIVNNTNAMRSTCLYIINTYITRIYMYTYTDVFYTVPGWILCLIMRYQRLELVLLECVCVWMNIIICTYVYTHARIPFSNNSPETKREKRPLDICVYTRISYTGVCTHKFITIQLAIFYNSDNCTFVLMYIINGREKRLAVHFFVHARGVLRLRPREYFT